MPSAIDPAPPTLAAVQHHLRNKLGIVRGTIDILNHCERLSENGIDDLARARRACDEMLLLIDNLAVSI